MINRGRKFPLFTASEELTELAAAKILQFVFEQMLIFSRSKGILIPDVNEKMSADLLPSDGGTTVVLIPGTRRLRQIMKKFVPYFHKHILKNMGKVCWGKYTGEEDGFKVTASGGYEEVDMGRYFKDDGYRSESTDKSV